MKSISTILAGGLLALALSLSAHARSGLDAGYIEFYAEQLQGTDREISYFRGIDVELGANYAENDIIELTLNSLGLDTKTLQSNVSATAGGDSITLGLLGTEQVEGTLIIRYRVTSVTGSTDGLTLEFQPGSFSPVDPDRWEFNTKDLDTDVLTIEFSAQTSNGLKLDTGGRRIEPLLASFNPLASHRVRSGELDAEIDLEEGRTRFVATKAAHSDTVRELALSPLGSTGSSDRLQELRDKYGNYLLSSGSANISTDYVAEHTIKGDFAWMLNDDGELREGVFDVYVENHVDDLTISDLDVTENSVSFNAAYNNGRMIDRFTIKFDLTDNEQAIPEQTFELHSEYAIDFDEGVKTDSSQETLGEWTLNAPTVSISYMPFRGPDISQVINVSNTGNWPAEVYVIARTEAGEKIDLGLVATIPATGTKAIAGDIVDALIAHQDFNADIRPAAGNSGIHRLSLDLMTLGQKANIGVYSAYNVDGTGARLVVNSSNGGGLSK